MAVGDRGQGGYGGTPGGGQGFGGGGGGGGGKAECRQWKSQGSCSYGDRCRFSHGPSQGGMGGGSIGALFSFVD